jgi:uncharacterized membrane protein YqhA
MLSKLISSSRFLVIFAIVGSLLAATLVMLFGIYDILRILLLILQGGLDAGDVTKKVAVGSIELIELFLLGTVLYVVALGLYQLFIAQDVELPSWLEIKTLDNLKERLLATVLVMLAVSFFGYAVTWDGGWSIIAPGVAIGFVIFGVSYALAHAIKEKHSGESHSSKK